MELVDEMRSRPDGRRVLHLVSNLLVHETGGALTKATFHVLAFADAEPPDPGPAQLTLPIAIDQYEAQFVRIDDRWLVSELQSERLFA